MKLKLKLNTTQKKKEINKYCSLPSNLHSHYSLLAPHSYCHTLTDSIHVHVISSPTIFNKFDISDIYLHLHHTKLKALELLITSISFFSFLHRENQRERKRKRSPSVTKRCYHSEGSPSWQ
jgi:hypothetical protein